MKNKAPILVLSILTTILVFIVGVRYGQHVESTNKQNAYNFKLATKIVPTAPRKQVKFVTYSHKQCKVEFVIPDSLKKLVESSVSASFKGDSGESLSFSCDKNATGTAELNPYTGRKVFFTISNELSPLLKNTLKWLR